MGTIHSEPVSVGAYIGTCDHELPGTPYLQFFPGLKPTVCVFYLDFSEIEEIGNSKSD